MPRQKQEPPQENGFESSEKQICCINEVDKENGKVLNDTIHSPAVRREEKEVDIPPGGRLPIAVACEGV